MSGLPQALQAHLDTGATTLCHAWTVTRADGAVLGFTDHDRPLAFGGVDYRPGSGMTALALAQTTGLAPDNTEGWGLLDDAALTEADIAAGRYDGAELAVWRVNWQDPAQRVRLFTGLFGEIRRAGARFEVEVQGLAALLNRPIGRVFQRDCSAVLGDAACGVDLDGAGFAWEGPLRAIPAPDTWAFDEAGSFAPGWFTEGRLVVLEGAQAGQSHAIKRDEVSGGERRITLAARPAGGAPEPGTRCRLVAGCDKRFETCRTKFGNALNFQGFPDLPGEDWVMLNPGRAARRDGGSRR